MNILWELLFMTLTFIHLIFKTNSFFYSELMD